MTYVCLRSTISKSRNICFETGWTELQIKYNLILYIASIFLSCSYFCVFALLPPLLHLHTLLPSRCFFLHFYHHNLVYLFIYFSSLTDVRVCICVCVCRCACVCVCCVCVRTIDCNRNWAVACGCLWNNKQINLKVWIKLVKNCAAYVPMEKTQLWPCTGFLDLVTWPWVTLT